MALWKVLDPRSKRSAVSTAGSSNSFCLGSGLKFGQVRLSGISTPSHLTPDPLLLVYRTQMGHPFHNESGLKFRIVLMSRRRESSYALYNPMSKRHHDLKYSPAMARRPLYLSSRATLMRRALPIFKSCRQLALLIIHRSRPVYLQQYFIIT